MEEFETNGDIQHSSDSIFVWVDQNGLVTYN